MAVDSFLRELSAQQPQHNRMAALSRLLPLLADSLSQTQQTQQTQQDTDALSRLWQTVRDLLRPSQPTDVRQKMFRLLFMLIPRLAQHDDPLRLHFFEVLAV